MGQLAVLEGRFEEAETTFRRVVEIDPKMINAWAALPLTRRMTSADGEWLKSTEQLATSAAIHPLDEVNLRFSMGKFCDDINDFGRAFLNFRRGNELLKSVAEDYDRKKRSQIIDEQIRTYPRGSIAKLASSGSPSAKPVFVVGMPRSGTTLAEQILSTHPAVYGAGEVDYWGSPSLKGVAPAQMAEQYLRILEGFSTNASRVVNKALVNSDFLGLIYSIFPNARVIYMRRDPIDTCLSCYFQQFLPGINFAFDLSDLAHYYREQRRIMAHWREVLPPGFMLEVQYEELVADQELWSRKMVEFIGLEWDARCLEFHTNPRQVLTASAWQVRQKMYRNSVARWRNYEQFIGPLRDLPK
jgi:hypothetical protein